MICQRLHSEVLPIFNRHFGSLDSIHPLKVGLELHKELSKLNYEQNSAKDLTPFAYGLKLSHENVVVGKIQKEKHPAFGGYGVFAVGKCSTNDVVGVLGGKVSLKICTVLTYGVIVCTSVFVVVDGTR